MSSWKKVELDKIDVYPIKKLLIEIGSPIIPLTIIFESLGFSGVTGIEWGILAGAIAALATELGYKVEKFGRSIILVKRREDFTRRNDATGSLSHGDKKTDQPNLTSMSEVLITKDSL